MTTAGQSHESDRIGFFSWFGYELPFAQRLKLLKTAGYAHISIWLGPEEKLVLDGIPEEMCALSADSRLHIECAHADYQDANLIWKGTDAQRRRLAEQMQRLIRLCLENGIGILVMHVCKGDAPPKPNPEGLEFIRGLVDGTPADGRVAIAIENTRNPEVINYVLSAIKAPNLGLCYDSSHDFLHSARPTELLKDWGHRLLYTHFSDNDGKQDSHWIPGEGIIDWDLIDTAFPHGFRGNISFEVQPKDRFSEPVEGFLAHSLEKATWLRDKLLRETGKEAS